MHPPKNPRKHHPRMPRRVRRGASWGGACTCPRLTRTTPHCARRTTSAQMKTGEGGYELAIIMSMIAHQRLRGGRVLGEGAGGGVDQDHRAEDDVPAHRRRSEDYEGRAETSQTSRRCARAQTIQCGGVCATQLGSDLTTYMLEMARTTTTTQQECNCHCFPCLLSGAPFGDMHSRLPSPRSALRDSDLLFSRGAYCFWFVPLLRMFRGTAGRRRACACARDTDEASTRAHTAHRPTRSTLRETRGASHVKTKAARRGVRACGSARGRGRCGRRGACSSSSLQSTRHTNGAGTSICVSRREPSSSRAVEKAFCMRFCFAVCPSSPPHLRCFRANGSEVDSPR